MRPLWIPTVVLLALSADDADAKKLVAGPGECVQAALDAASPGDTVIVKGWHHENVQINTPNVTLRGKGGTIDGQYLDRCVHVLAAGVTVEGLTLLHGTIGIDVGADDARIVGNVIRGASLSSIEVLGDDVMIKANALHDGGGITVDSSSSSVTTIEGNDLRRCERLDATGGAYLVSGNDVLGGAGIDISADHPTVSTRIAGNSLERIEDTALEVSTEAAPTLRVIGNTVRFVEENGIEVDVDGDADAIVRKNTVDRCGYSGLAVTTAGSASLVIEKNDVSSSEDDYGIEVYAYHESALTILGGRVEASGDSGIYVEHDDQATVEIRGVEVRHANDHGVEVYADASGASSITIVDCDIRDIGNHGVRVDGDDTAGIAVIGCSIRDCRLDGISMETGAPVVVGNTIRSCGERGVHVATPTSHATVLLVEANDVRKCGGDGIQLDGDSASIVIRWNDCRKNDGDGIDLRNATGVVLTDNDFRKNLHEGIDNDATGTFVLDNTCLGNGTGLGPDIAGAGKGSGTVQEFVGNKHGTGGADTAQRLDS